MTIDPSQPHETQPHVSHTHNGTRRAKPTIWALLPGGSIVVLGCAGVAFGLWCAAAAVLDVVSLKTIGLNFEHFRRIVEDHTTQAALVYVGAYTMLGALVLPGSALFVVASGLFFGTALGIPLSILASMTAATSAFLVARTALGQRMTAVKSPWFTKVKAGFGRHALGYLLFLRLTPGLPFAALNVVPSVLGVPLATFALGTFIGLLPSRIALSTAGAGLGHAIEKQNAMYSQCLAGKAVHGHDCAYRLDAGSLLTNETVAAFLALAILALVPALIDTAPRVWQRITTSSRE